MNWYLSKAKQVNKTCEALALQHQSQLTKPPGSLGRLESLACQLAGLQGQEKPTCNKVTIALFAGDHGVVDEGVSAFPQSVTSAMLDNFVAGGAAISVMAKELEAQLMVVNTGVATDKIFADAVWHKPVAKGTKNFAKTVAMSADQLQQALLIGKDIVDDVDAKGCDIFIGGEMGIGNTTSATALAHFYTGLPLNVLTGAGTGMTAAGIAHKQQVIEKAFVLHGKIKDECHALHIFSGFEIAALVGAFIRAAQCGIPILVDGFIVTTAALAAIKINPSIAPWLIYSHCSAEAGHKALLNYLEVEPIVNLQLRLGEASGAAAVIPLLRMACALHNNMATFAEAGISAGDS